jgi:hypothetical protein
VDGNLNEDNDVGALVIGCVFPALGHGPLYLLACRWHDVIVTRLRHRSCGSELWRRSEGRVEVVMDITALACVTLLLTALNGIGSVRKYFSIDILYLIILLNKAG